MSAITESIPLDSHVAASASAPRCVALSDERIGRGWMDELRIASQAVTAKEDYGASSIFLPLLLSHCPIFESKDCHDLPATAS